MRICTVDDCKTKHYGQGYCHKHWKRWKAHGDPAYLPVRHEKICIVSDCKRKQRANQLCDPHNKSWKSNGVVPTGSVKHVVFRGIAGTCLRSDCDELTRGSGYCDRHYARMKRLINNYGLDGFDDFDRLWKRCGGRCEICGMMLELDSKDTHIDHSHVTGEVRGVLCRGCNHGLGHFQDSPERLFSAITYLRRRRY
jgi:hypothetical protein